MHDYRYPDDYRPTGMYGNGRYVANVAALELVADLTEAPRDLTPAEQERLARWSGWGACADSLTNPHNLDRLTKLLGRDGIDAARQSTINAHYTPLWLARHMWSIIEQHAPAGLVLEPGCGHGVFIGTAPDPAMLVGVEKEPATAAIARLLYPSAQVIAAPLEQTPVAEASFAAAIGNVPFANVKPYDRESNPGRKMSLHNYAIWRALNAVQPGGIVALLTSRYTMDSQTSYHRERFASLANLITAVRFPSGAFAEMAGTKAIIDLLVFQRVEQPDPDPIWIHAERADVAGGSYPSGWQTRTVNAGQAVLNNWWVEHPELVLGVAGTDRGLYADDEYVVGDDGRDLPAITGEIVAGLAFPIVTPSDDAAPVVVERSAEAIDRLPGSILADGAGFVSVVNPGTGTVAVHDPGKDANELRSLCKLRDSVSAVLDAQTAPERWASLAAELNVLYDAHVARYGALNRSTLSERVSADGETIVTRRLPKMGGFRDDPLWPLVAALEEYDDTTATARKAAIFDRRVLVERPLPDVAGDPVAALAACLAERARVDVERISELCAIPVGEVVEALAGGGHIFHDPVQRRWVTRSEYLSGDVRSKLAAARRALESAGAPA